MSSSTAWLQDGVEKLWIRELDDNGAETGDFIRILGIASENFTRNVNERTVLADGVTFYKDGKFQDYSGDVVFYTERPDLMKFFRPGELTESGGVYTFTEKASQAVKKFALYVQSTIVAAVGNATGKKWKRYPNVSASNFADPSTSGEIASFTATISALVNDATDSPLDINWDPAGIGLNVGADTTAPTLSSTSPADAATGVAVDAALTATFSERMNVQSLVEGVRIAKSDGTVVAYATPAEVTEAPWTYTFTPSSDLDSSSDYDFILSEKCRDVAGNAKATLDIVSFATA